MADEPPLPFDNDDPAAFPEALGRLNQIMHDAPTRAAQDEAIQRIMAFLEHQRAKREYTPQPPKLAIVRSDDDQAGT